MCRREGSDVLWSTQDPERRPAGSVGHVPRFLRQLLEQPGNHIQPSRCKPLKHSIHWMIASLYSCFCTCSVIMWVTEACVYQADRIMHQTPSEDSDCGFRRPRHRRNHLQRNRPGNGAYLVYEGHNNYFAALLYYFDLSLLSYITQMGWTEMEWTRTQSSPVPLWGTIGGRYRSRTGTSYAAMPVLLPCTVRRTWSPWCPTEGRYTH